MSASRSSRAFPYFELHSQVSCLVHHAEDITYLVFFIFYQYYFAVLKLYAMFTLHVTAWGTRAGVGGPDKKDTLAEVDDIQLELERLANEEKAQEARVKMARKGRTAAKTYQKGNIALMRRIHNQNQEDEVWHLPRLFTCVSAIVFYAALRR